MATYNSEAPTLDTYQVVVLAFSEFLTVAIHTILYERQLYPRTSFLAARKYNCPVRQSRHPKVCRWIQDAVAAVEVEMLKCALSTVSLVIHAPPPSSAPLERYVFSTAAFPSVPSSELLTPFTNNPPPTTDLPEQFRATITKLCTLSSALSPLPQDCSFTVVAELRDDPDIQAPLRSETPWIAAAPELQKQRTNAKDAHEENRDQQRPNVGKDLGGVRTTPIRNLDSGVFALEMWIEESAGKFEEGICDAEGSSLA
ncbi:MAG: hypothetical protein Q9183_003585 [Haloplaca sp. 2 TL-2023]